MKLIKYLSTLLLFLSLTICAKAQIESTIYCAGEINFLKQTAMLSPTAGLGIGADFTFGNILVGAGFDVNARETYNFRYYRHSYPVPGNRYYYYFLNEKIGYRFPINTNGGRRINVIPQAGAGMYLDGISGEPVEPDSKMLIFAGAELELNIVSNFYIYARTSILTTASAAFGFNSALGLSVHF